MQPTWELHDRLAKALSVAQVSHQSVLGHADLATTSIYLRGVPSDRVRAAVEQAAAGL